MNTFYFFMLLTSIFMFFLVISSWIKMRIRIKNNLFLKAGIGFVLTFSINYVLISLFHLFELSIVFYFERLMLILIVLIFFAGYLFYEAFLNVRPPIWRLLLMYSFLISSLWLIVLNVLGLFESETLFFYTFLIGTASSIFGIYVTRNTLKVVKHPGLKIDLLSLFILLFGTILAEILGLFRFYTNEGYDHPVIQALFIFTTFLIIGAFMLLGFNSYFHGDYIHLMPVKIYSILVYNQGGILVYHREIFVQTQDLFKFDEGLFSGALSAFSTFFRETLGKKTTLSFVEAGEYDFMFSPLPEDNGTCVLIVSNANYYLKRFLGILSREMPQEVLENLNNPVRIADFKEIIDHHIINSIPYVKFRDSK